MKPLLWSLSAACALVLCPIVRGAAIPLTEARVERIVNEVQVLQPAKGPRSAELHQVIKDDLAVRTGQKSRCELRFQDETLTRLGAETLFSFTEGTRDMTLDSGTMLLQVPKKHGGATIRTGAVSASVTGTTLMVEHLPNKSVKILVLEGSVRVEMNGHPGEKVFVTAGRMVLVQPQDKKLARPVNVDLQKIIKTSVLVDPAKFAGTKQPKAAVLPSMPLIADAIDAQAKLIKNGTLVTTNLAIPGRGTDVVSIAATDGAGTATRASDRTNATRLAGERTAATNSTASGSGTALVSNRVVDQISKSVDGGRIKGANQGSGTKTVDTTGSSGSSADNSGNGGGNSGQGSDSSGSGSDNSGKGSESSGKGSDNSGKGSENSGSGSSSSGRGRGGSLKDLLEVLRELKDNSGKDNSGKGSSGKGKSGRG
jgi:hypothetical protein